jgi:hypothetical protein
MELSPGGVGDVFSIDDVSNRIRRGSLHGQQPFLREAGFCCTENVSQRVVFVAEEKVFVLERERQI